MVALTESLAYPLPVLGIYLSSNLPPANSVPIGTPAQTFDQGTLYSNGTSWQNTPFLFPTSAITTVYTPPFTGSVATTVSAKLAQTVSVLDFGATGNGVTNDTAAFTAAIASGGPIWVPWTANFYAVTALTAAQLALLWGPGLIKIAGVAQPISTQAPPGQSTEAMQQVFNQALAPGQLASNGFGVGFGTSYSLTTRTGGFPQYGNALIQYLIKANIATGFFESNLTAWVTATNMSAGAQVFGGWVGSNSPSSALGETFPGGAVIGYEINVGNRWSDFGWQATDVGGQYYSTGIQLVPDVVPTVDTAQTTVTTSSSGNLVVNWTAHGLPINTPVSLSSTGTLPTTSPQITQSTPGYYIVPTGYTANSFELSVTPYGTPITVSAAGSGVITGIGNFPGSFAEVVGASVHGHRWWTDHHVRFDTIMPNGNISYVSGTSQTVWNTSNATFTGTTANVTLASVSCNGAGAFACTATTLVAGQVLYVSGAASGTGTIVGYTNPTPYLIATTNGTTTFTLTTMNGVAVTTTTGTLTMSFVITTLTVSGVTGNIANGAVLICNGFVGIPNGTAIGSSTSATSYTLIPPPGLTITAIGPLGMTTNWAPLSYATVVGNLVNGLDFASAVFSGNPIRMPGSTPIFNSTGYGNAFGGSPQTGINGGSAGTLAQLWSHVAYMTATLRGEGLFNL